MHRSDFGADFGAVVDVDVDARANADVDLADEDGSLPQADSGFGSDLQLGLELDRLGLALLLERYLLAAPLRVLPPLQQSRPADQVLSPYHPQSHLLVPGSLPALLLHQGHQLAVGSA